ncbi:hypothetical protein BAE44_0025020 [Dichanthelium oligosanthes]|uniref:EF-hand domain-containing protein n=1 Tax=Dichanthelium oligosanthes TaxID=888268 RepID=A0A1E5UM60_9POAL|nr:hypothetical protein BAE44_0025020 [Dichanthelium oligosanthes]
MFSFREPSQLITYLLTFLAAAASAFVGSHSSLPHALARALVPSVAAKSAYGASLDRDGDEEEEEMEAASSSAAVSKEEVEAIMGAIGLTAAGRGEGLAAAIGRDEVSRLFDAEEPSFAEVRSAFAVFDGDRDGFIGAADLQGALARLGVREDAAACRAMIAAAGGGRDGRMTLFQFVGFLENGLC